MTGIANNATLNPGPTDYRDLRVAMAMMDTMCVDFADDISGPGYQMRCSECGKVSAVRSSEDVGQHLVVCEHILAEIVELYENTHVGPSVALPSDITLAGMKIYLHEDAPQEHIEC